MVFLIIIGGIIATLLKGIALISLWNWFVVPLGVMPIGFWHALGLSSLITYLTIYQIPEKTPNPTKSLIESCILSLIILFFGWIYHMFM